MTSLTTQLNRARHTLAAMVTWGADATEHRTRVRRAEHASTVAAGPADLGLALAVSASLHAPSVRAPELAASTTAAARHTRRTAMRARAVRG
ncbi:hypothetical protein [Streptomyces sp. NBC_01465]|uniref:hypothetical protein n=1 Tax=Streptomyces sp. NBC_01465 TaxID=2903878 RepID=UPI002E351E2C|nr:hypothetical protein [Streptomyces sp. NBC_01465]